MQLAQGIFPHSTPCSGGRGGGRRGAAFYPLSSSSIPSATPRTVGVTNFLEKGVLKGRAAGSPPQPFGAFVVLPNDKI